MLRFAVLLAVLSSGCALVQPRFHDAEVCEGNLNWTPAYLTSDAETRLFFNAKAVLKHNEGVRARVYTDSAGLPTVGVGFSVARYDAADRLRAIGTSRARVLRGDALSTEQIDKLLDMDVRDSIADLRQLFPNFDRMPMNAQLVLVDLRFNCGPGGLRSFKNTLLDFQQARWHTAASRLEASQWATQVGSRAVRSISMLRELA